VVNMDADGQHQPEELERLVTPIVKNEADFIVGSRFLGHYEERGSIRHLGVVLFSWVVSLLTSTKVTDCTNGFRALRVSDLERLSLQEEQFHTTELIIEASKRKLRYKEVPISVLRRAEGESKKPKRLRYPLGVLRTIINTWLR
jgi:glycosyltransferase involved in cell wall biosynthesis